jgi:hypothetical protein
VSFILIRCCPRPFLGSILHTAICDFGKVYFILEIACVAVILIWSLSSLFLVTSFVPRHKITFPASNAKRLGQFHQNTINASVSGATLDNVEQCISLSTSKIKTPNTHIGKVILCLGTNDVTRNRDDSDQINITATQAISKIKQTFPKSQISVCSILPRKGRGQHLSVYVKSFVKMYVCVLLCCLLSF